MNLISLIDVAEQIQQDRVNLRQEDNASFQALELLMREIMELNPQMAVGVIFVLAAELLIEAENKHLGLEPQ